ncbi:necrosis inducing protein [Colletotrichum tofieldiae]|uniref:Necrosis inducing protein n=1 Tax=Colletotrichum tofieldiae TaxID=708197 RepID=A0A161YJE6_9PEZI|nr:necrosis inducing protein [Colletotrichum tofieldiae]GKT63381.1 necrosis inducing protein [Colletotrichum tofieldiae]GKT72610.1 necrosis inducing protein [Colletotrichum tofieldiae]GKT89556.1 necrosis inducing protein [Colletotrichum tofieldiae]
MLVSALLPTLGLLSAALGAPLDNILERREEVSHDSLSPSSQKVQDNAIGSAIVRFNPLLHIAHGCQPYTAVDDAGNTSGGLKPSGSSDGGCKDTSKGQTYARGTWHNDKYAIMYAWYFPKDMPNDGVSAGSHRHDWESVVVWLNNPSVENPSILGGAASGHGDFKPTTNPQREGDSLKVEYFTQTLRNHELQFTATTGRTYPVLDWDAMSTTVQNALNNTDFGQANVPFKDENFFDNLDEASI